MASANKNIILLISLLLLTAVVAAACRPGDPGRSTGAYPIEIFQEMHYNPSHKAGEPPRFLPPEGSIPVSGANMPVGNKEQERDRQNPLSPTAEVQEYGALLYMRDCSMCHGRDSAGQGALVGERLAAYGAVLPPPLNTERMQALTAGEMLASITNGFGLMPPFGHLLTEQERWAIIALIEAPEQQRDAALQAAGALTGDAARGLATDERALRLLELRDQ